MMFGSYVRAQAFPAKQEKSFEDWVSNRFGKRLFNTFFKTYTEKVWGIPCSEISADWAAQRIKGLSLISTIKSALLSGQATNNGEIIKTLIDAFDYPEKGPGQMWEMVADDIQTRNSEIKMKSSVEKILWEKGEVTGLEINCDGRRETVAGTDFISSMPIQELINKMEPEVPAEVGKAARLLGYRDFLTVSLIIDKADLFGDNWIYIHDSEVKVGRIQNFICFLAVGGLILLFPVLLSCALLVRLSSPGAILFRQIRIGREGKPFTLYKFRTMFTGRAGLPITAKTDHRITFWGKFLRASKLDELPELYNILRGDMSLVRPRPKVPELVDFANPAWRKILTVRPGITPVTIRLRNEEVLLVGVEDKNSFYLEVIQPFKLNGYLEYVKKNAGKPIWK